MESKSFGKIKIGGGSDKSYILCYDESADKSKSLANIEYKYHIELANSIAIWLTRNPCTKQEVVDWKNEQIKNSWLPGDDDDPEAMPDEDIGNEDLCPKENEEEEEEEKSCDGYRGWDSHAEEADVDT